MHAAIVLSAIASAVVATPAQTSYHADKDLIVVGRVENLSYEHVDFPEDVLGHGWITAKLHVKRVVRGRAPGRVLQVRYFAHTYRREDRDFRFHLRKTDDSTYVVCTERPVDGMRCK